MADENEKDETGTEDGGESVAGVGEETGTGEGTSEGAEEAAEDSGEEAGE